MPRCGKRSYDHDEIYDFESVMRRYCGVKQAIVSRSGLLGVSHPSFKQIHHFVDGSDSAARSARSVIVHGFQMRSRGCFFRLQSHMADSEMLMKFFGDMVQHLVAGMAIRHNQMTGQRDIRGAQ